MENFTYIVQKGDTLSGIADLFDGVDINQDGVFDYVDIATRNGIENPNLITVGQEIVIPTEPTKNETNTGCYKEVGRQLGEKENPPDSEEENPPDGEDEGERKNTGGLPDRDKIQPPPWYDDNKF